jgi:hypothetical protein
MTTPCGIKNLVLVDKIFVMIAIVDSRAPGQQKSILLSLKK